MYIIYINTQKVSLSFKKTKKKNILLLGLSKAYNYLYTINCQDSKTIQYIVNMTWLAIISLFQHQCNTVVTLNVPETRRLPVSEQAILKLLQLCLQYNCCCIVNTFYTYRILEFVKNIRKFQICKSPVCVTLVGGLRICSA